MVIDFDKIPEVKQMDFKGGKGALDTRNFEDEHVKIMYSTPSGRTQRPAQA